MYSEFAELEATQIWVKYLIFYLFIFSVFLKQQVQSVAKKQLRVSGGST